MRNYVKRYQKSLIAFVSIIGLLIFLSLLLLVIPFDNVVKPFDYTKEDYKVNDTGVVIWQDNDIVNDYINQIHTDRYKNFGSKNVDLSNGITYALRINKNNKAELSTKNYAMKVHVIESDITSPQMHYIITRKFKHGCDITSRYMGVDYVVNGNTISVNYKKDKGRISTYFPPDFVSDYVDNYPFTNVNTAKDEQLFLLEIPRNSGIGINNIIFN